MKFCFDCNKVITVENVWLHASHKIGEKTFQQIYDEAIRKDESKRH